MSDYTYEIAVSMLPGLGCSSARQLMNIVEKAEKLFAMTRAELVELFGNHTTIIDSILNKETIGRAEREVEFCEKHQIRILYMTDKEYPQRLNRSECTDTPMILYCLGDVDLNPERAISVVGTRSSTDYGRELARKLIEELQGEEITVVSGLALGIDTVAHESALRYGMPTVGTLGHGLDMIYPSQNRKLAKAIIHQGGGLVTEMRSETKLHPGLFPARNRIIAALSDATIVVEASQKGGALITANIANSYHRDLFAFPGRIGDKQSAGCNAIIASCKAMMIRNSEDLLINMGWAHKRLNIGQQKEIFPTIEGDEAILYNIIQEHQGISIEEIKQFCDLSLPKIATGLLSLELKNLCRCLPGKIYKTM